jgi:hypothetical protein
MNFKLKNFCYKLWVEFLRFLGTIASTLLIGALLYLLVSAIGWVASLFPFVKNLFITSHWPMFDAGMSVLMVLGFGFLLALFVWSVYTMVKNLWDQS